MSDALNERLRAAIESVLVAVRAIAKTQEDRLPPIVARMARDYCKRDGADPDAVISMSLPMFHGKKPGYLWQDGYGLRPIAMDFSSVSSGLCLAWEIYVEDARTAFKLVEEYTK